MGTPNKDLIAQLRKDGHDEAADRLLYYDTQDPFQKVTGLALITVERQRQLLEEGWTPEHDAEYSFDELVWAAICYATPELEREYRERSCPIVWPWAEEWWKPGDRLRELSKAGALIAAEIDRYLEAPGCSTCKDKGWLCEQHPDLPFEHEPDCNGPGFPCDDCNPMSKAGGS